MTQWIHLHVKKSKVALKTNRSMAGLLGLGFDRDPLGSLSRGQHAHVGCLVWVYIYIYVIYSYALFFVENKQGSTGFLLKQATILT